jgi:hypothetical protein
MTTEELTRRLEQLRSQLAAIEEGGVERSERARFERIQKSIRRIEETLAARGIVDVGEAMVVETRMLPYDDREFKSAFRDSLREWSQDAEMALNGAQGYFRSESDGGGVTLNDVLGAVSLVFTAYPPAAIVANTIAVVNTFVTGIYKATAPAQPNVSELHHLWTSALGEYRRTTSFDREFEAFVSDYKREERVPADVDMAVRDIFLDACQNAASRFPNRAHIQRSFLSEILQSVPDAALDGEDYAGVAEVKMLEIASNFSSPSGQLDDVNEPLMNAIRTVWSRDRVINLPVPIIFSIRNVNSAETAVIKRDSKTPGDTSFRLEGGFDADRASRIFDAFMKQRIYRIPLVSDLSHDD